MNQSKNNENAPCITNSEDKRMSAVSCQNSVNRVNNGDNLNTRFEIFMDLIAQTGSQ
jgi:hypothetical protein